MKRIVFQRTFEKHYAKRIAPNRKLTKLYAERFTQFISGERAQPINDHSLAGNLKGKRAFSIAGDVRVVYEETDEEYIFLDIGTHNQVYR